jgi:predicted GNAT family acetyltransferase
VNAERYHDPVRFRDETTSFLVHDERRHNLILGVSDTLAVNPTLFPELAFWVVREADEIAACALRASPYNLVLARPRDDEALAVLAEAIDIELPGVVGAVPEVDAFTDAWVARTGATPRVAIEQGVYALEAVAPVVQAPGRSREAAESDFELVFEWFLAFSREAMHDDHDPSVVERRVRQRLGGSSPGGFTIWEVAGAPVSISGYGGRTPNGIRIGPVYTPPEQRGRGYATSLVAEQSARLLREGRTFCFLYTDLANPTANAIYERIGYVRVCESRQIDFE